MFLKANIGRNQNMRLISSFNPKFTVENESFHELPTGSKNEFNFSRMKNVELIQIGGDSEQ